MPRNGSNPLDESRIGNALDAKDTLGCSNDETTVGEFGNTIATMPLSPTVR